MFYDPTFILVLPALFFAMYAQFKVNTTFSRYLRERSYAGFTGGQIARQILDDNGLHNVNVERISGRLTDHYDPRTNTVRLSARDRQMSTAAPALPPWALPPTRWAMLCSMPKNMRHWP
jgi:Zn-dependent membrane protease YugP